MNLYELRFTTQSGEYAVAQTYAEHGEAWLILRSLGDTCYDGTTLAIRPGMSLTVVDVTPFEYTHAKDL